MSTYGGSMADMLEPKDRALIWPFFALSPLLGMLARLWKTANDYHG